MLEVKLFKKLYLYDKCRNFLILKAINSKNI